MFSERAKASFCALGGPPHPIIVTTRDNLEQNIKVLLYTFYITTTGWGSSLGAYVI